MNGSPASAMVGGAMAGSGSPAGAGRSGPSPMAVRVWGARAASVTWSVISDWSTRDCRVYREPRRRPAESPDGEANEPSPSRYRMSTRMGHACARRAERSGATCAVRLVRAHRHTSSMTTMDSEPIPTEPTTDPEPPVTTPVVPGPSLASESPAAGRGRGPKFRRAVIGLALVVTFSVGIGVGRLDLPALGGFGSTTPAPGDLVHGLRAHPGSLGHPAHASTSARTRSTTASSSTAPSTA